MTIQPTRAQKIEWARMAQAAYLSDHNWTGHRFSGLASIPDAASLPLAVYDTAMSHYRAWLIANEYPQRDDANDELTH